jgi:predicted nuclease of predicted toxin-antitoxin system
MSIPALADSDIARSTRRLLENYGFQVDSVDVRLGSGIPDQIVADLARRENRVLISGDKIFANGRKYPPSMYTGIIVIRVKPLTAERMNRAIQSFLSQSTLADYRGLFVVVTATKARIIGQKTP